MVKRLFIALIILAPSIVQAQTVVGDRGRFGTAVTVGGTTFSGTSSLRLTNLATKGAETDCLWINANGDVARGACGGGLTSITLGFGTDLDSIFNVTTEDTPCTGPTCSFSFGFDTQSANVVLAGPTSGGAADPTFRSLVKADHPAAVVFDDDANTFTLSQALDGGLTVDSNFSVSGTTGEITTASDLNVNGGDIKSTGALNITPGGSGNLKLNPGGDVEFDPTGNDLLPTTGYDLNIGALSNKYLTLHAAELWVETLVAQETIATIGGRILVGPTTSLTKDIGSGLTYICVKHNQIANGDRVYLEANAKIEFMAITSTPTTDHANCNAGVTDYYYTVTRNLDGTGANDWFAGDAVFNTGTTGDGFMDLYSVRGVKAASEAGPTIVGNERTGTTYNQWEPRWAIGNLNGLYNVGVDTYGAAFGEPDGRHLLIQGSGANSKVEFKDNTTVMGAFTSSSLSLGLSTANTLELTNTVLSFKNNGDAKVVMDSSGNLSLANSLAIGNPTPTGIDTNTGIWIAYNAGTPQFRVGVPAGNRVRWDGTNLTVVSGDLTLDSTGININRSLSGGDWDFETAKAVRWTGFTASGTSNVGVYTYENSSGSLEYQKLRFVVDPGGTLHDGIVEFFVRGANDARYAWFNISTFPTNTQITLGAQEIVLGGDLLSGNGSATDPKYTFANALTTGMYLSDDTNEVLAFTSNGTARAYIRGTGYEFEVVGDIYASGNITAGGGTFEGQAATALALASNGGNCTYPQFALGVDASGVAECSSLPASSGGDITDVDINPSTNLFIDPGNCGGPACTISLAFRTDLTARYALLVPAAGGAPAFRALEDADIPDLAFTGGADVTGSLANAQVVNDSHTHADGTVGDITLGGDLSGTTASAVVADDSHSHTDAYVANDLEINSTKRITTLLTTEQFRASYDADSYMALTIGSTGIATFNVDDPATAEAFAFSDKVTVNADFTATGTTTLNTGLTGFLKAASGVVSAGGVSFSDITWGAQTNWSVLAANGSGVVSFQVLAENHLLHTYASTMAFNAGFSVDSPAFAVADGGALTTSQLATFNGGITADGGVFAVADTSGNTTVGDLSVNGGNINTDDATLYIDDNLQISGTYTLGVGGAATVTGNLAVNGGAITSTAGTLVINPSGIIDLEDSTTFGSSAAADNYASRTMGWGVTYAGGADFRSLFSDELRVKVFTTEMTQAVNGSMIWTKSVAELSGETTVGGAVTCPTAGGASETWWFRDFPGAPNIRVFQANDYVLLRTLAWADGGANGAAELTVSDCIVLVATYTDGTVGNDGYQSWTLTRPASGGGAMANGGAIPLASQGLNFGVSTDGFLEATVTDGTDNANAPYFGVATWATTPASANRTARVRLGQLRGITSTDEYGFFTGAYATSDGAYIRASSVTGLEIHGSDLSLWDGTTRTVRLSPDYSGSAGDQPSFALGNPLPTSYGTGGGIWMGDDAGTYKFRVGDVASTEFIAWDGSTLTVRGSIHADDVDAATLSAISADLGTVTAGSLTISGTGFIKSSGVTNFTTGSGFYLDYTTVGRVRVGNPTGEYVSFDGANLAVNTSYVKLDTTGIHIPADIVGSGAETNAYAFSGLEGTNKLWLGSYKSDSLQGFLLNNYCESDDTCVGDFKAQSGTQTSQISMQAATALAYIAYTVPDGLGANGYHSFSFDADTVLKITETTVQIDAGETLTSSGATLAIGDSIDVTGDIFGTGAIRTVASAPVLQMRDSDEGVDGKTWSFLVDAGDLKIGPATDTYVQYTTLTISRTGTDVDSFAIQEDGSGRFTFNLDNTCSGMTNPCFRTDGDDLFINSDASQDLYLQYDTQTGTWIGQHLYVGYPSTGGVVYTDQVVLGFNGTYPVVTTQDTDENLTLNPNGTGVVYFHGSTHYWDDNGDIYANGYARPTGSFPTGATNTYHLCDDSGWIQRCSASSIRYKENVESLVVDPAQVLKLRPVSFNYKTNPGQWNIGLIAEEVYEAGLIGVVGFNDEGQIENVSYDKLPVYMLPVLQNHEARIAELEARIRALEARQ